jgi:hypothetical protein
VEGVLSFIKGILFLPARILSGKGNK